MNGIKVIEGVLTGVLGNSAYAILKKLASKSIGSLDDRLMDDLYNSIDDASKRFFDKYNDRFGSESNCFLARQDNWETIINSIFYSEKEVSIDDINPNPFDDSEVPTISEITYFTKLIYEEMSKKWKLNEIITKKRHMSRVEEDLEYIKQKLKNKQELLKENKTIFNGNKQKDEQVEFSNNLKETILKFNITIEKLTKDQFKIIQWLRGHRKASISGSAGSGKTLVAVEKAIRLDYAGLNTLILCHSPHLSEYIKKLTLRTGIQVYDFYGWIKEILGIKSKSKDIWTHYEEPSQEEIEYAFDKVNGRFDAIIIDEGQDFRDTWWLIIESALVNPNTGILYIFYDDNQALLPFRASFPINEAPFSLSKNCRNAGKIFEVLRNLHPQAPEPEVFLKRSGIYHKNEFDDGNEAQAIAQAINSAITNIQKSDLLILTTEADPSSTSILNGMTIEISTKFKWQDAVNKYIDVLLSHYRFYKSKMLPEKMKTSYKLISRPNLSEGNFPTEHDIDSIREYVYSFVTRPIDDKTAIPLKKLKWLKTSDKLYLGKTGFYSLRDFFTTDKWIETLPRPVNIKIKAVSNNLNKTSEDYIRLLTVSSYKGLEADSIILFVRDYNDSLKTNLYVGISRAKFCLHIVLSKKTSYRIKAI